MVQFNELKIAYDSSKLIIDVSVKDSANYVNVYLSEILIDSQDTFIASGPSSSVLYTKNVGSEVKSIRLELTNADVLPSFENNLFFVYVKTTGNPTANTPCGEDNSLSTGVVYNLYPIYQYMFKYIVELEKNCIIPKNFINAILQFKALQVSIAAQRYTDSVKLWKKFFRNLKNNVVINSTRCNG